MDSDRLMMAVNAGLAHSHLEQAKVLRDRVEYRSRLKDTDTGELVWAMIHAHEAAAKALIEAVSQDA